MMALRHMAVLFGALLTVGCAQPPTKPLYMWENFPRQQYEVLLGTPTAIEEQIRTMQAHADKASASGAELPPGFRAHLGMLQLSAGNTGEARTLWETEKKVFPESSVYMEQLLKRLNPPLNKAAPT